MVIFKVVSYCLGLTHELEHLSLSLLPLDYYDFDGIYEMKQVQLFLSSFITGKDTHICC